MLLGRYLHRYWESEFFKKKTIPSATGNVNLKGDSSYGVAGKKEDKITSSFS